MPTQWAESLQAWNGSHKPPEKDREEQVTEALSELLLDCRRKDAKTDASVNAVPRFFFKKVAHPAELQTKFVKQMRTRFLQKKSTAVIGNNELGLLWDLLHDNASPPFDADSQSINYDDYCKGVVSQLPEKFATILTARTFLKLTHDTYGRVPVTLIYHYAMRRAHFYEHRLRLSYYDPTGAGYIREVDMENYIFEHIPTIACLTSLEQSFYKFYVCTAVRKFFFFLDFNKKGKLRIKDLLASPLFSEYLELRSELTVEEEERNWFSGQCALRVYGLYLFLDVDHNGMLSKQELMRYGTGTLTSVFVDRVFQECQTYEAEMDYKNFLDFVLAMENKKTPQALAYFFKLLDIKKQGYLTTFTINYFFRAIVLALIAADHDPVLVEDVRDEIFDMVKPVDPLKITLEDLINCRVGDTVVSMLIDMNGFWNYDNRESLVNEDDDE